jgi:hypothetical protein
MAPTAGADRTYMRAPTRCGIRESGVCPSPHGLNFIKMIGSLGCGFPLLLTPLLHPRIRSVVRPGGGCRRDVCWCGCGGLWWWLWYGAGMRGCWCADRPRFVVHNPQRCFLSRRVARSVCLPARPVSRVPLPWALPRRLSRR